MKWHKFTKGVGANRQKLPAVKKPVLVKMYCANVLQNLIVVGYLKHHAGMRSEPYFITPGLPQESKTVVAWCDCLQADTYSNLSTTC